MSRDVRLPRWLLVPLDLPVRDVIGELPLTGGQRAAVERRDGAVFLRAGAGTGKTTVLVERFVRSVLEDGVEVERLLAITFTDKAAAELKTRIRGRFVELGHRDRARAAESARISTFHGLCSRILRAHSLAAGIDPEYRVLDQAEASRLAADAFDLALGEFLDDPAQDRLDLAAGYTPAKLERMVRTVHARLRSSGQREPELPELDSPPGPGDPDALGHATAAALKQLASGGGVTIERAVEKLERCVEEIAALAGGRTPTLDAFDGLAIAGGTTKALQADCVDAYNLELERWSAALAATKGHADYALLRELLRRYVGAYARAKDHRSGLDFDDLELRVRDLLRSDDDLRERYRERFERVMVDEFQDVNELQAELLRLLARPEALFTVGDDRQSIYLFRHADVGLFRQRAAEADAAGELLKLTVNFRARPAVLEQLNGCWEEAFEDGFDPLEPGREAPDTPDAPDHATPSVELLVTDRSPKRWKEHFGEDDEQPFGEALDGVPSWRAAEARLVAKRIAELVEGARHGPGDIVVLLRATSDMRAYERALEELGIPTYLVGGRGYWDQQQVLDLRAYLASLANPHDGQAMLSVLASPLVGLTLDGLALAGRRARAAERSLLWVLEQDDGWDAPLGERDRDRIAEFVGRFDAERRAAARRSLEHVIDHAITISGYDRAILALPGGERRMANVRKLMRLARDYEADEGRDLRGFIDYLDLQGDIEAREGEAPLEAEALGAVRLMTIHAAKGLEFPVVFLADLGREGRGDEREPLQVSDDGRVGLSLESLGGPAGDGLALAEIKERQRARHEAEERRIFYVGMTRAQERLIVSGASDLEKLPAPKPLGAPMDWAWRALGQTLEARTEASSVHGGVALTTCSPETLDEVLPAAFRKPGSGGEAGDAAQTGEAEVPAYAAVEATEPLAVSRLSYSSLGSYGECGYRFYLERALRLPRAEAAAGAGPTPGGDAGEEGLTPLVRGQIVHELLEALDFERPAAPDREAVAGRIRAAGLTAAEADLDDLIGLVEAFLGSSLCERLGGCEGVLSELPFAFTLDPDLPSRAQAAPGRSLLVNGIVDVHARDADVTLVVDYKSDHLGETSPDELCERKYSTQRRIYALAALREGAARVEVVYCLLERPDDLVSATYMQADAGALEDQLLELAAGVIGGRFPVSEAPNRELCSGCPGEDGLCPWPLERTRAEPVSSDAP